MFDKTMFDITMTMINKTMFNKAMTIVSFLVPMVQVQVCISKKE